MTTGSSWLLAALAAVATLPGLPAWAQAPAFVASDPAPAGELRPSQPDPSISRPAPWSRLPDGRLVVEIMGQQLGLPTDEPQPDIITFAADGQHHMTLREAMADPSRADALFRGARGNVNVAIPTPEFRQGRKGAPVLLGIFRRDPDPIGFMLSVTMWRRPGDPRIIRLNEDESLWSAPTGPDAFGFTRKTGPITPGRKTSNEERFRLPAEKRLWQTHRDLVINCLYTAARRSECHFEFKSKNRLIAVSSDFYWNASIDIGPVVEKSEWILLDKRQRSIADYVLLNSPDGDLE